MRAGKKPSSKPAKQGFSGGNMQQQMMKIQAMQRQMEETQAELESMEETASAGGGAVTVTVTGAKKVKKIAIKPEAVDPEDIETLEDLVLVAVNEALRKADELSENEMSKITGGLNLPGFM
ncbi:MAG: YbaB/EbfC family nucleoid-associated protein [Eubacteriales bacterium]